MKTCPHCGATVKLAKSKTCQKAQCRARKFREKRDRIIALREAAKRSGMNTHRAVLLGANSEGRVRG